MSVFIPVMRPIRLFTCPWMTKLQLRVKQISLRGINCIKCYEQQKWTQSEKEFKAKKF